MPARRRCHQKNNLRDLQIMHHKQRADRSRHILFGEAMGRNTTNAAMTITATKIQRPKLKPQNNLILQSASALIAGM